MIKAQLKILKRKLVFEIIKKNKLIINKLNKKVYLINVNYSFNRAFEKISNKSKNYISDCFKEGLKILNSKQSNIIINGPISKRNFYKTNILE